MDGEHQPSETMNDEIHMKSDESYSTHIRRQSDSSFICEVMIVEVCLSTVCVFIQYVLLLWWQESIK